MLNIHGTVGFPYEIRIFPLTVKAHLRHISEACT